MLALNGTSGSLLYDTKDTWFTFSVGDGNGNIKMFFWTQDTFAIRRRLCKLYPSLNHRHNNVIVGPMLFSLGGGERSLADVVVADASGAGMIDSATFRDMLQQRQPWLQEEAYAVRFSSYLFPPLLWIHISHYFGWVSFIMFYLGGWVMSITPWSLCILPSFVNGLRWLSSGSRHSLSIGVPTELVLG